MAQCQIRPLQVPLTRRLWRLDTVYWATSPSGLVVCCFGGLGLYLVNLGNVVGAGNCKVLAVFRCLHGGHEARADAEGYGSIKAAEVGPLPTGRDPRPSGRGGCRVHLHSVYG